MSSTVATLRRNQNITRSRLEFQTGPITAGIMLLALVILLSLLYLNQVTKTSLYNYKISNLQNTQSKLETEKQNLQIEAARAQSIAESKSKAASAGMVKTDTVSYVQGR